VGEAADWHRLIEGKWMGGVRKREGRVRKGWEHAV